jgi:transcriptional antiterminator RfaH
MGARQAVTAEWYLVYTKPRGEQTALENLSRQGYSVYLPRVRIRRRRGSRYVFRVEPLFPRYLFIHLNPGKDDWGPIRSTLGVSSLVRFGGIPAAVPEGFVRMLQEREDEHGLQILPSNEPVVGEAVRIVDGVMRGYEGVLVARSGKERAVVLLELANKYVRVQLAAGQLEKADADH